MRICIFVCFVSFQSQEQCLAYSRTQYIFVEWIKGDFSHVDKQKVSKCGIYCTCSFSNLIIQCLSRVCSETSPQGIQSLGGGTHAVILWFITTRSMYLVFRFSSWHRALHTWDVLWWEVHRCFFVTLLRWLLDRTHRYKLVASGANMSLEGWDFQPHSLISGEGGGAGDWI